MLPRTNRIWSRLILLGLTGLALSSLVLAAATAPEIVGEAFRPRSRPRGATLFSPMPPRETGVMAENKYADPRMWGELYQELTFGTVGTGVAIGDYDNDGRPDLFVVSKTEKSRLFRNLGDWKFEDVTDRAGLGGESPSSPGAAPWQQGVTFVDVNNDGLLDIYVCRFNAPNLLYINQGDGTFKEEAAKRGLAVVDASGMAAFCDYDCDGWLDVFVQTNMLNAREHPGGQRNYLFHNNRDGTFTDVTDRAGITGEACGHSATWWDYDSDGWPDLYVANDYAAPDKLYHNNGDGTFTDRAVDVLPHSPYYAMGSDLGDVNNDGSIDFFVADMAPSSHQKNQRGMATSRVLNQKETADPSQPPQLMRNALYLNTGRGAMLEAAQMAGISATDWTWSVRLEDLDNDGRLDLFVTNGMIREYHNVDVLERIMGGESVGEQRRLMRSGPVLNEANFAFRNLGDLRFENVGSAWGLDQVGVSFGAAFGDLDGDGDLDLIYANYQAGPTLLRNDGCTGHSTIISLRGTASNRFGVGATVKLETPSGVQVRQLVLARGYLSSSDPVIHFGLGNDPGISRLEVRWPSGQTQCFSHLPVDRHFTITEPAMKRPDALVGQEKVADRFTEVTHAVKIWQPVESGGDAARAVQARLPRRLNRCEPATAVADWDGDGLDDILFGGDPKNALRLLRGTAQGEFSAVPLPARPKSVLQDGPVLIFDADGDGLNDLLVTKAGTALPAGDAGYQPTLWLNDGRGGLKESSPGFLPVLHLSVGALAAADFDHDGHLDLFVGARYLPGKYPLAPKSALLAYRANKLEDVTDAVAPGLREIGMVTSALWSDLDGDGWPDLLVSLEWGGVRYWHNVRGERLEDWSERAGFESAGTGWWTSLATADFNGDGHPDFAVGNQGLNTPYHATADQPTVLYYGALLGGGTPQIMEGYYENDRLYARSTRKELASSMPAIVKRFPKNDDFAHATLGEIFSEDQLARARRFTVTELRSGVFLSQPDGRYTFEPLPRLAQISPIQGLVAGDFDGDGQADLYAFQNDYSANPATGPFDGGLSQLLRGDGQGHFTAVSPAESNLVVRGDAKALAVIDLNHDGWPDFVGTRSNGESVAYRNNGVGGRHMLAVRLQGAVGNVTAIGARVQIELSDGALQTAEVVAGSGYRSQSTASVFFGYLDSVSPRRVLVRWPKGEKTEHRIPPGVLTLVLTGP